MTLYSVPGVIAAVVLTIAREEISFESFTNRGGELVAAQTPGLAARQLAAPKNIIDDSKHDECRDDCQHSEKPGAADEQEVTEGADTARNREHDKNYGFAALTKGGVPAHDSTLEMTKPAGRANTAARRFL